MDTKILLKLLEDQADPAKVPAMEAYMKNKFSFLGVQKPILKKIEREFFKPFIKDPIDWTFVEECWQQPYREFQYIAMDYLDKKKKELRPEGIGSNQIMVGQYRSIGPYHWRDYFSLSRNQEYHAPMES